MEIRRIRPDEGPRLKALRLAALADSPDAFGTTVAETRRETDRFWRERAEVGALSADDIIVVAVDADEWWGLARGSWEEELADTVELASVWVHPDRRRLGIAAALTEAVASWAKERGAASAVGHRDQRSGSRLVRPAWLRRNRRDSTPPVEPDPPGNSHGSSASPLIDVGGTLHV